MVYKGDTMVTYQKPSTATMDKNANHNVNKTGQQMTTTAQAANGKHRVTFSDMVAPSVLNNYTNYTPTAYISASISSPITQPLKTPCSILINRPIYRTQSMESRDNPFLPDSDLSKETDDLLRRSTISRTQVILDDPAKVHGQNGVYEDSIEQFSVSQVESLPDANQNSTKLARPDDVKLGEKNHVVDGPGSPQSVEVEVGIVVPAADSHMQVEHVKLKEKKRCQCCLVM